ncbi:hypothetical protein BDW02DRAFT_598853 [Decorospora gaudefroyi]|uniref:Uncharacterized protein n=1 Tax=Decorospora gaudefroyi TaxID=184978 RepID=A0A6A5KE58_9PLEO|nr:hypothetical protein BDW02DRAFT_598853 [Decorospora gaudefroyi]
MGRGSTTDAMDFDNMKPPTPDATKSPLFDPEVSSFVLPHLSMPTAVMLAPTSATASSPLDSNLAAAVPKTVELSILADEHGQGQEVGSEFVRKLRSIEAAAKAEMSGWAAAHLGQESEAAGVASVASAKRKASEMTDDTVSGTTDDDSDDGDDRVPAYDPTEQERPRLPFYHPGFKLTVSIAMAVVATLSQYITKAINSGYKDDEAKHLRKDIVDNKKIPYQESIQLAVAGDTGAGKSAVMNAILGVPNLNIESDGGSACTCVITEFRQAPPSQTKAFAAEVEFFDITICLKLVKDLFVQWYRANQKQRQDPDEMDDVDLNQMKTARDCLQQMFANHLDQAPIEKFMSTATSETDQKIITQLSTWTTGIHQRFVSIGETSVHFESSTPENLIEQYHPFTKDVANAIFRGNPMACSPWPLVKMVRVFLNSAILQQKVSVADVPGGADVNYFRTQSASRYLQSCHMTVVVAKIDRIADDLSFRQQYVDAYRRRRSGSVILVGTKSDILNTEINSTLKLDLAAEDQLATIAQKVADIDRKTQIIDNEIGRNSIENKLKANKPLKKQKKKLTLRKIGLAKQRKDILIGARNKQVAHAVGESYRENTGDDAGAAMYCVSNLMYMRHLRGYDKTDELSIPTMTLDQTQIPALCSHIYSLPSRGRMSDLDHFVRATLPTVLNIIQISISTTNLARAKHLIGIIREARTKMGRRIEKLAEKFRNMHIKLLHDQLADPGLQTKFDKNAMKKLLQWEGLNANTHRAICNKKGILIQKKKNLQIDWNEDLLSPARAQMDIAFRVIIDEACEIFKAEAAQETKEVIRQLDYELKNDPKAQACDAYGACFEKNVSLFYGNIDRHVAAAAKTLKDGLIQVHLHAIRLRNEDDYFPRAMQGIYETAYKTKAASKGKTMKLARQQYLKDAIPGPTGPFSSLAGWAEEDAEATITKASDELKKNINNMLLNVQQAFDRMKGRKDNDTEEGKKFRKELHEMVGEARRILNGVAQESLDLCKQYK